MNAPTSKWNHDSGVTCCDVCQGAGVVPAARRATVNDPYPESPCECERGPHEPECPVCGFGIALPGYDCFVCDFAHELPAGSGDAVVKHVADALASALAAKERHFAKVRLAEMHAAERAAREQEWAA